jgi:NADH-ubiquinone oxidoreductase chain 5
MLKVGYNYSYKMIDKGLIEMFGPYGLSTIFSFLSQQFILLQTGYIFNYSLLILISTLFLINIVFASLILNINFAIIFLLFLIFSILKIIDNKNI